MSGINSCFMLMVAACISLCLLANAGLGDDFIDLGDTDALDLGNYAYLGSYDSRTVASYGNNNLSLSNMMENSLWSSLDGTLQKTHNTAMYSDGSELLSIYEITAFSGYDLLGNQYSSRKETSVDLSNFNFPFILLSSEIILLDADDLDWQSTQTENYLLLPEMSDDLYSQISDVLANTGSTKIITFDETTDPMAALQSAGFNLSQFFGEDKMDEFMEPLRNEEMWDIIREMAQKEMDRQKAEAERDVATDFSASSGGVVCFWGYRE